MTRIINVSDAERVQEKYIWAGRLHNPHSLAMLAFKRSERRLSTNAAAQNAQNLYKIKKDTHK